MTKYQRITCLIICFLLAEAISVIWLKYLSEKEYKGLNISNEYLKRTTVANLPSTSTIEVYQVDKKARVSCYIDTGIMAGGKQTYKGAVAVSDRSIPMGTKIYIESFGEMTVEDKTAKLVHIKFTLPTIDIWMTEKECKEFGLKELSYIIVK